MSGHGDPTILFLARVPPNAEGPGGSQRAMHLLNGLRRHGSVDFLLVFREGDREAMADRLDAVRPLVAHCRSHEVTEWAPSYRRWPRLSWRMGQVAEALTVGSVDAPRFSSRSVDGIGAMLPRRDYDLVFAARLSSACIADALIARGQLSARRRIVDLDDMISRFKRRDLAEHGDGQGRLRRMLQKRDIGRLADAERHIVATWDAVSVSNDRDAHDLSLDSGPAGRRVFELPNVVDRPHLPPTDDGLRLLFVGHLGYSPNVQGLHRFLDDAWPRIRAARPDAIFDVVGMHPDAALAERIVSAGAALHADVPSVAPYYRRATMVIAPIWVGSGTRIKIIEAMAFGRPVVATTIGAEGLGVVPDRDAMIADEPADIAAAVLSLAADRGRRDLLIRHGLELQRRRFSVAAFDAEMDRMIADRGSDVARRGLA